MSTVVFMVMGNTIAVEFKEDLSKLSKDEINSFLYRPISHRLMLMADFIFTLDRNIIKNREDGTKTIDGFLNGDKLTFDHYIIYKDDNSHIKELNAIIKCCENVLKWSNQREQLSKEFDSQNGIKITLGGKDIYIDTFDFKNKERLKELTAAITIHADKQYRIFDDAYAVEIFKKLRSILRMSENVKLIDKL